MGVLKVNKCPHCNSINGVYTKQRASGSVIFYYNYDGSFHENGQMHDSLKYSGGKVYYCKDCNKKVLNVN
jgi:DNA-directed RNA polymerase subunit RPC12/RpoP